MKKLKIILPYSIYVFLILSFVYSYCFNINFKSKYNNQKTIYGTIIYYLIEDDKLTLILDAKEKMLCNYYFNDDSELSEFKYKYKLGDYIKLDGNLKVPSNNTIFNNFNYKEYLRYEGINYIFEISTISKLRNNNKLRYKIKNLIIDKIEKNVFKDYLYTFILGNNKYIDSDVMESYRTNGISHLFSVSGMHVSMISLIVLKLLNKFKFKNIIVIIILLFYMFLTDFSPSILRSGIFFILLHINKSLNLKISNIHLMFLLLAICIFIDPYILFKIGFQYSYLISFALILFSNLINRQKGYIRKTFIISLISFLVSFPISINNFYQINFLSVILNVFFVPILSLFLFPMVLISFLIDLNFFSIFIKIFETASLLISKIDIFVLVLGKINIFMCIIYYIVIFYSLYSIKYRKYKNILILVVLIFYHSIYPYFSKNYEVTFIDVSQGDSVFMRFPNNQGNVLIDTGGKVSYKKEEKDNKSYLSQSIIMYIKSYGIKKIDYLILTHGDYDHMGEAINLVNNFKVEKVIFNCGEFNELEKDLIKVLDKKKIPYYSCIKELNIDDNKLYFLNNKDYGNENDNSSVIYTELNNNKFLFMGDAGIEVEEDLIEKYNLQDIDVLKVGHHGSKTSSSKNFIDEINPKYSIISVGKNNRYGHPNDSVLDNLENSRIYRTDQDGSIMFKIENDKLQKETCSS